MPKPTFFNLPEEKRSAIEEAAILEFRNHPFAGASINRIVECSGISKGSFYQYFDDKEDVYFHIISLIGREKMKYLEPKLLNPEQVSFFEIIREIYRSGIEFGLSNPDYLEIGNKMMRDPTMTARLKVHFGDTGLGVYKELIRKGQANGEIRADLDVDLGARMLMNMQLSLVEYYFEKHRDLGYSMAILEDLDRFIQIMKFGFYGEADQ